MMSRLGLRLDGLPFFFNDVNDLQNVSGYI